jgi:glucose-1-phosphate adenylyltransferase
MIIDAYPNTKTYFIEIKMLCGVDGMKSLDKNKDNINQEIIKHLRKTLALVLAGGRGSRLMQLTDWHAKPAIPFGGKYRIIDFTLSNCINSGIRRIGVATQYKAHSLIQHVQRGWGFMRGQFGEFVEVLPAQQRTDDESWYLGTADAVFQNLDIMRDHNPEYVLVLAGDHIYKMDYGQMLADHITHGAEVSVACIEAPINDAKAFGVMGIDAERNIVRFDEKPAKPMSIPGKPDFALASMGIYLFNADLLYRELLDDAARVDSDHDFGKNIIPSLIGRCKLLAHRFEDSCVKTTGRGIYWRDVGTIDAYWEANMDLTKVTPDLNLYDSNWPILTNQEQAPGAKFVFDSDSRRGMAVDSLVSGGCIVSGSSVRRSLLFTNVRINSYCEIEDSVILPNCNIGRHARLRKVVVDHGCAIPPGMIIGEDPAIDAQRFHRTKSGITLVTQKMMATLG